MNIFELNDFLFNAVKRSETKEVVCENKSIDCHIKGSHKSCWITEDHDCHLSPEDGCDCSVQFGELKVKL